MRGERQLDFARYWNMTAKESNFHHRLLLRLVRITTDSCLTIDQAIKT